jgi:glycosyltransferase involved in cell wall biosynthesis
LNLNPEIDKNKVFYIYNGVEDFPESKKMKIHTPIEICCVGSIADRKGQQFIVEALKRLTKVERSLIHFSLLGDGAMKIPLEKECQLHGLQQAISFVGETKDVQLYLNKSDIFILPSKDEGLPMAIIEAMRSSLPIISTRVGGIPEMIEHGYNGILIEPNAEALYHVLKDINKYDWLLMGANSRKVFDEKFSGSRMVKEYASILTF